MKVVIKKDGQCIKRYPGAYKYAITQNFEIPTVDDSEKSKLVGNTEENVELESEETIESQSLNEENIEEMLGEPSIDDYDNIFNLGQSA